ncbi:TolC family outer membrane protein [Methylocaldum szegediense]|jgi:outer membrane protein|uniref:Outer membrane protein TolC n=1 Tax=Methylocaldum szegediense TaxID=73780 RepID=A0ABM9I6G3_9GAMM|nr:TolC family outer membrane protein [Methylocaldum szegediense]CAI8922415.1 Outer membrane protein TolC [Methylocaldum szegediense]
MKKSLLLAVSLLASAVANAQDLLQTLELALQRDPRLREAEATRNAVLEAKPQSVARLLPTLSITGELNRNSVLSKFEDSILAFIAGGRNLGFWNSAASINLTQPIYHHDYWVQLSQADNQIAEAEANYAAEQQNLMLRTARAYFDVLFAQDSLEFARAEQRAIEHQLEEAKARFEVGLIAITDVHEAQAGYDQAHANVIQAENQVDNAREALREIIGEFDFDLAKLAEEIPLKGPDPENIESWAELAQQTNPSIIAAENRSLVAKKGIDLQFAGHLPSMDLVGSAGFTDTNRPQGIPTEYQIIGMQVNVPMFAGGGVNSRVRQARHEYEAAQENLDGVRRSIQRQVKDAYRGILSTISQVKALEAAIVSSQSALEATEAGLEVGTRTMVDVLTEQRNLFRTKRDYARARYDYILNSLTLKQAAGTLNPADFAIVNEWLKPHARKTVVAPDDPGA